MAEIDKPKASEHSVPRYVSGDAQNAPQPKSAPSSEVAGPAHGELAATAAAYLERSGSSLESFGGNPQEVDRQAASLVEWARQESLLLSEDYTAGLLKHLSTTAEHQVFYRVRQPGRQMYLSRDLWSDTGPQRRATCSNAIVLFT